ncbi:Demethylrebeccamycin-D-glucose O-methyltransferase [Anaerohalosphaera lusitana]|uniref:Demethylrebeccamycin-D-glucose O-methyltransferase n=1 Tax=Anaerohalosphaera lusitana TaxID=1936003 RepID=A0A1U9NL28_9BACT|nr:class I SAM-dependent methyltransferase [Anaerohalosphaera lusitana]AQT68216.1 Demethylrebeccamycin-D-glucose O-methyltransferase [Anaerohalosphaera lusitana]
MKCNEEISVEDVQEVYSGAEMRLWELLMGEQIHVGGLESSMELAEKAGIQAGSRGVDLCCCTGAGMKFLVRMCGVESMVGIDVTEMMVAEARERAHQEGLAERLEFVHADACATGLADGMYDFVWGEDAWCYVKDKDTLIVEAVRLVRDGGEIAFTDWVEGAVAMNENEAERFLRFMKFANVQDVDGYAGLLEATGCEVEIAEDTGRFAGCCDLYIDSVRRQYMYDALKILGFDMDALGAVAEEMCFLRDMAKAGKICQALFVAKKKG